MENILTSVVRAILGKPTGAVQAFKAVGGGLWVAGHTNNFQDSHREILSAKSHQHYVNRVKLGLVPMPELWHWHKEATKHGQADMVDLIKHPSGATSVFAIGHFDDTPAGHAAEAHYKEHGPYSLSHGFIYPAWARSKDGVFAEYNTFEISTLPRGKAANPYTTFEEVTAMSAITEEMKASIKGMFGNAAPEILSQLEAVEKTAEKAVETGARFKDFANPDQPETAEKSAATFDPTIFGVMLKAQTDQGATLELIANAMTAWGTRSKADHDAVAAKIVELEALRTKLDGEIQLLPTRVKSAIDALEDDVEEKAEKALEGEETAGQYDPMFPGMKVPVPAKQ